MQEGQGAGRAPLRPGRVCNCATTCVKTKPQNEFVGFSSHNQGHNANGQFQAIRSPPQASHHALAHLNIPELRHQAPCSVLPMRQLCVLASHLAMLESEPQMLKVQRLRLPAEMEIQQHPRGDSGVPAWELPRVYHSRVHPLYLDVRHPVTTPQLLKSCLVQTHLRIARHR